MLSSIKKFSVVLFALCSMQAHALLISPDTEMDESAYLYNYNNSGLDWAWVAPSSRQFSNCVISDAQDYLDVVYTGPEQCENQLLAPSYRDDGWQYFDGSYADLVAAFPGFGAFVDAQGQLIIAYEYFNTTYDLFNGSPDLGESPNEIYSDWTDPVFLNAASSVPSLFSWDIFYVRVSTPKTTPDPAPVNEPASILIMGLSLLFLGRRLKSRR